MAGASGNGTQVTHYSIGYNDVYGFGPVSCTGVHQVQTKGKVTTTTESFTCTSTDPSGSPLSGVAPNETVTLPGGGGQGTIPGWNSDFDGAPASTFSATVSSNGMSYTAVATY
jgi:hypothetical protein